jgi:hypothetical protein
MFGSLARLEGSCERDSHAPVLFSFLFDLGDPHVPDLIGPADMGASAGL